MSPGLGKAAVTPLLTRSTCRHRLHHTPTHQLVALPAPQPCTRPLSRGSPLARGRRGSRGRRRSPAAPPGAPGQAAFSLVLVGSIRVGRLLSSTDLGKTLDTLTPVHCRAMAGRRREVQIITILHMAAMEQKKLVLQGKYSGCKVQGAGCRARHWRDCYPHWRPGHTPSLHPPSSLPLTLPFFSSLFALFLIYLYRKSFRLI